MNKLITHKYGWPISFIKPSEFHMRNNIYREYIVEGMEESLAMTCANKSLKNYFKNKGRFYWFSRSDINYILTVPKNGQPMISINNGIEKSLHDVIMKGIEVSK